MSFAIPELVDRANKWLIDATGKSGLSFVQKEDFLQLQTEASFNLADKPAVNMKLDEPWAIEITLLPGATFTVCAIVTTKGCHRTANGDGWPDTADPEPIDTYSDLEHAIERLLVERYREQLRVNLETAALDRIAHDAFKGMVEDAFESAGAPCAMECGNVRAIGDIYCEACRSGVRE